MSNLTLRQATAADYDFLFNLHKITLRTYIEQVWHWNEAWQQANFSHHFEPANRQIVVLKGEDIGVISVRRKRGAIHLSTIQILPAYQKQGFGAQLIQATLDKAFGEGLPVTLQVLKGNPARRLYERLGFVVVVEAHTHYLMRARSGQNKVDQPQT